MSSPGSGLALVHDSQTYDGMRSVFLQYARALRQAGLSPAMYTCIDPSLESRYSIDGTAIRGWRVPGGGAFEMATNRLLGVFTRQLAKLPQHPVHVHSVHLAALARRRSDVVVGVPDLAKRTTRLYPASSSWLHNTLLRSLPGAAAVVTYTEWSRTEISRVTGYPLDRIVAAPPYSLIPPRAEAIPVPVDSPTEERPWTLLYVAVDRPHKNVTLFLKLIESLDKRFRGVYVGRLTLAHQEAMRRAGLEGRLELLDRLSDLAPVYRRAHILVFPSLYEGFGVPLIEAMSQGLPILSSTATCLPEVVGTGGRLIPPQDLSAWKEAVLDLSDPIRHRGAQRASYERSFQFTPERTAEALRRAYSIATPPGFR